MNDQFESKPTYKVTYFWIPDETSSEVLVQDWADVEAIIKNEGSRRLSEVYAKKNERFKSIEEFLEYYCRYRSRSWTTVTFKVLDPNCRSPIE